MKRANWLLTVQSSYHCFEQDEIHERLHYNSKKEQLDALKKEFDLPTYDVASFEYTETASAKPVIAETVQLNADNYATLSGKRMFVMPNVLTKSAGTS